MIMDISCTFISGAANTTSSSVVWLPGKNCNVIAYSIHNVIAVVDFVTSRVLETLRGHDGRINCLVCTESFLVSCSDDSSVRVWKHQNSMWIAYKKLHGFSNKSIVALSCIDTLYGLIVAVADAKGSTFIWLCPKDQNHLTSMNDDTEPLFFVLDTFVMPPAQMPHALHLTEIPTTTGITYPHIFLFIGSVDARIHIRLALTDSILNKIKVGQSTVSTTAPIPCSPSTFLPMGTLFGHEEWVTTLCSVAMDDHTIMIASGSQDSKIRLWRIVLSTPIAAAAVGSSGSSRNDGSSTASAVLTEFNHSNAEEEDEEEDVVLDAPDYAVELCPDESLSEARLMFDIRDYNASWTDGNDNNSGGSVATGSIRVCSIFLEALLLGHEDWVTSVQWMKHITQSVTTTTNNNTAAVPHRYRLFSTSMDRNMVIWDPDAVTGVWSPVVRVGDIGGQLGGSVGGNLLGFVDGCVSIDSSYMIGVGYGGSLHLWSAQEVEASGEGGGGSNDITKTNMAMMKDGRKYGIHRVSDTSRGIDVSNNSTDISQRGIESQRNAWSGSEQWSPVPFVTGHFGPVNDLAWSADSQYIVSVSSDQTCRLFAPIGYGPHSTEPSVKSSRVSTCYATWRELSRPQIHGYDLHSVALAPSMFGEKVTMQHRLYTGADEKLLRVFDAPSIVLEGLEGLVPGEHVHHTLSTSTTTSSVTTTAETAMRVHRAYIPELGLSNRAADMMTSQELAEQSSRNVQGLTWTTLPLESQLSDFTVWPEVQKLYGHDHAIMCVRISHNGRWLASSCKARDSKDAKILLWDTDKFVCVGSLIGHESTVVCMRFSPNDDEYLATAGKDRTLCIHMSTSSSASASAGRESSGSSGCIVDGSGSGSGSNPHGVSPYRHVVSVPAAHKRIIWTCDWTADGKLLATGSRDGVCKLWAIQINKTNDHDHNAASLPSSTTIQCLHSFTPFQSTAVTALDFGPCIQTHHQSLHALWSSSTTDTNRNNTPSSSSSSLLLPNQSHLLALGSELGDISYWEIQTSRNDASSSSSITSTFIRLTNASDAHGATVKCVVFAPIDKTIRSLDDHANGLTVRLASCGEDHCVRMFDVSLVRQNHSNA